MTTQENEYRCTRRGPYQGDCPGKTDVSARQGYYIRAENEHSARVKLVAMLETDGLYNLNDQLYGFDVQLWKENISAAYRGQVSRK